MNHQGKWEVAYENMQKFEKCDVCKIRRKFSASHIATYME